MSAHEIARMSVSSATARVGSATMKIRVAMPMRNWPMIALASWSRSVRAVAEDIVAARTTISAPARTVGVRLPAMSEEALRKLAMQVRNWGRWGPSDEIGTLNFITPDAVA